MSEIKTNKNKNFGYKKGYRKPYQNKNASDKEGNAISSAQSVKAQKRAGITYNRHNKT